MLTDKEKELLKSDFLAWSGGHTPDECLPEDIDVYVDGAAPDELDPGEVEQFLTTWADEPYVPPTDEELGLNEDLVGEIVFPYERARAEVDADLRDAALEDKYDFIKEGR